MGDPDLGAPSESVRPIDRLVAAWPRLFAGEVPPASWVPEGWLGLVVELCAQLDSLLTDTEASRFKVEQVKEKFGTLRFYVQLLPGPDATHSRETMSRMEDLIDTASALSAQTCQRCGQPGTTARFGGLAATMCVEHAKELQSPPEEST